MSGFVNMATIRSRKNKDGSNANFQFQAIIEMKNRATGLTHKESKTFDTEKEATDWAAGVEDKLKSGTYNDTRELDATPLKDLISRYIKEESPKKLGAKQEITRLNKWLKNDLAERNLSKLRPKDFAAYIAARRKDISARGGRVAEQTIKLEVIAISNVFEIARKDWGYDIPNPTKTISMPKGSGAREARITPSDWKKISAVLINKCRNPLYVTIAELAIETGMREDELFRMTWDDVNLPGRKVIVDGKNTATVGERKKRTVPLSVRAVELLEGLPRCIENEPLVFQSVRKTSKDGLSRAFSAACADIGLDDGCFHSTRHEAASRMAPHYPMLTLMKIFGWKTPSMAARYYHASDEELLEGLDKMHKANQRF